MREILFRGKSAENGEWYVGNLSSSFINKPSGTIISYRICEFNYGYEEEEGYAPIYMSGFDECVIPDTIGQYTGLTDKNGTKIFEGDIVKVKYTGVNKGLDGIAKVVFDNCKFALVWGYHNELVCLADFCNVTFEVIGNIHDNPELLKSEVQGE